MCGIAGYINLDGKNVDPLLIKKMTDSIAHRGPDGEGLWYEGNVGLGHRRLSILDLSDAGAQPMLSSEGRYVLSYNGEIYNHQELREELKRNGLSFNSQTDTEVVLNALIFWGEKALKKFNGMFGLALWDRKEKKLLLARDRYGIKPVYYAKQNNIFFFASEQKAFNSNKEFNRNLNKKAVLEYFTFQNILTRQTFLNDVFILPPGNYGVIDLNKVSPRLELIEYWDFDFKSPTAVCDVKDYELELNRLLKQAVRRQLNADVEVGAYLSGGMDSGSITSIASKKLPYIKTFTCGFDLHSASGLELAYDEREQAEYMSYCYKTEHYEMVLKAGDMERCLSDIAYHLEEPRVGQSYPNYYAAKLASRFVKVVLSGAGGDELFGGYPWRYYRAVVNDNFEDYVDKYYLFWHRLIPNSDLCKVFSPIWEEVKDVWTRDIFRDVFQHHADELYTPQDYINHSLYFEAKTFLHGLLVVEDKLSMSHGLETRYPFLDNDLVDFAMSCPVELKINRLNEVAKFNENDFGNKIENYYKKTKDGKQILRDAMKGNLPVSVTNAEKQGFSAPDASWFKGESIDFVKNKLIKNDARIYEFMDRSNVERLVKEHLDGKRNRRLLIWSLLNFEESLKFI